MLRQETTNLNTVAVPESQEVAVAYFLQGARTDRMKAPEAGPLNVKQQREVVSSAAKSAGIVITKRYIDFETESDTNRPSLRRLLDYAQKNGITRCLVADRCYVADFEGAELFWNAMFNMAGVELVEAETLLRQS